MSGAQLTTPARRLSALNAAAAWKASCVNLNSTSAGCTPALMSAFSTKKCDGEFCASTTVLPRRSAIVLIASRTTMPSPPFDQSTCWKTRGMTRESLRSPSRNSGSMSSVAQPTWRLPAAYASRIAIGSSISTSSTLKSLPPGVFQTLPGLKPLLA